LVFEDNEFLDAAPLNGVLLFDGDELDEAPNELLLLLFLLNPPEKEFVEEVPPGLLPLLDFEENGFLDAAPLNGLLFFDVDELDEAPNDPLLLLFLLNPLEKEFVEEVPPRH